MPLSAEAIIGIIGIVLVAPHTVFAIEKRCSRRKRHTAQELLKFIELHPHQRAEILKATPVYALLLEEGCLLLSVKSLRQPEQQQQ
ncbi:hypothetical protein MGN70_013861 [Eutypa lata]|nr:hypothetical protein MGN70_013861 [Eutypa lata]